MSLIGEFTEIGHKPGHFCTVDPNLKEYYAVCRYAIQVDPHNLMHVHATNMSDYEYKLLCEAAITLDWRCLKYVERRRFGQDDYKSLCMLAIDKDVLAGRLINKDYLYHEDFYVDLVSKYPEAIHDIHDLYDTGYIEVFKKLVALDADLLQHLKVTRVGEFYYTICLKAVQKDGNALRWVMRYYLNDDQRKTLCTIAVTSIPSALKYVFKLIDTNTDTYDQLCTIALTLESGSYVFINDMEKRKNIGQFIRD